MPGVRGSRQVVAAVMPRRTLVGLVTPCTTRAFSPVGLEQVAFFTSEYVLRVYSIVEETDASGKHVYAGRWGRLQWAMTDFYSWVDLASIVPFYLDILVAEDLPATQFIRCGAVRMRMAMGSLNFVIRYCYSRHES